MRLNCGVLESPLDCKEINPVHPKGNQSWILIERTDAEAKAQILWPPDVKSQSIGKDPNAELDWKQEKRGPEDEMVEITDSTDMNLGKLQEIVRDRREWCAAFHEVTKSQTHLDTEQQA